MIGNDYMRLAEAYGMTRDQGIAYGIVDGYAVTFLDGTGCHRIMITTRFESNARKDELMEVINAQDLKGLYRIRKLQIAKKVVHIAFKGGAESLEKIPAFIEWFFPLLREYGACEADVCVQCQETIDPEEAQWVLRDGAVSFRMHRRCADELKSQLGVQTAVGSSNLGRGLVGAAIGAGLGAVLWLLLAALNWFTPICGMAIGWLCSTLYCKRGGTPTKLQLIPLILVALLGVVLGVLLGEVPALVQQDGNIFTLFWSLLTTSAIVQEGLWSNLGMGTLMMLLGLFISYRSNSRKTTAYTVTDLN